MENTIDVGHPFFFPIQVIIVDDDPYFLDGISLMLDKTPATSYFSQHLKHWIMQTSRINR